MEIRYSMIQDFLTCPKAFYDRHILGKIKLQRSSALEYGTALHLGIRTILDGEDGVEPFIMYWDSLKDTHMQYYEHSWKNLRELAVDNFLPNFKSRHSKKFSNYSQELQMSTGFLDKHSIKGTADFFGSYEGIPTVVDWKTSSRAYRKNKIEVNLQLYVYAKLIKETQGITPKQIMYKVFNKKDGSINTLKKELTESEIDDSFKLIENAAKNMLHAIETKQLHHGAECYCERA